MILIASCMLKASPGPIPGAPLKSPMVSLTKPNPLKFGSVTGRHLPPLPAVPPQPPVGTDPGPEARLTRLKRLNISPRSCTCSRSRIGTSFKIEKSTLPYPGPWNLLRDTLPKSSTPPCESPTLGPVGHDPTPAAQNAVGLIHCVPPPLAEKLRETPA